MKKGARMIRRRGRRFADKIMRNYIGARSDAKPVTTFC
jgi:hypothetical protein